MVSGLACAGVFVHGMGVVIAGQSLDALGCVHQRGRVVVVASGYHLCLRATGIGPVIACAPAASILCSVCRHL